VNNSWWKAKDELDPKQKGVFDLPLAQSHLILGPPGSGKTNLLLLRASQLVLSGKPNILVLVFTRTLREFVVTGGAQYAFGADRVRTLDSWRLEFLREQGVRPAKNDDFEKKRHEQLDQIRQAIETRHLSKLYEAIVLDEAQDYLAEELDLFFHLGRAVFAAADSRQQIYMTGKTSGGCDLQTRFQKNVYALKHHYRNGRKICEVADELAKGWSGYDLMVPTSNYKEAAFPSSVQIRNCPDLAGQIAKVVDGLVLQMKAYPSEFLGVLCPTRAALKVVWEQLKGSPVAGLMVLQSAEDGYVPFEDGKPICVCTIHGAKGLEFRGVHILDAESIKKSSLNRNIAYMAVTRAKTSLSIYHTSPLPPYLDSALNVVRPPVPLAKLDQLFGGS
jgi:superfamily I DNA/RNA helicase